MRSETHRHQDILEVVTLGHRDQSRTLRTGQSDLYLVVLQIAENIGKEVDVEADIDRITLIINSNIVVAFFLIRVGALNGKQTGAEQPAHPLELVGSENSRTLQSLQQSFTADQEHLVVIRRNNAFVIRVRSFEQLSRHFNAIEGKAGLIGSEINLDRNFLVVILFREKALQFEDRLAGNRDAHVFRHNAVLVRSDFTEGKTAAVSRHRAHLSVLDNKTDGAMA